MNKRIIIGTLLGCLFGTTVGYSASVVNLPHTFTAGTPIKASEVNANFQALATEINNLSSRMGKLEGNIIAADLVGTYRVNGLQSELGGGNNPEVNSYTQEGIITLAANGTGTYAIVENGHSLHGNISGMNTLSTWHKSESGGTIAWSFANGEVTLFGDIKFYIVAGGQFLIASTSNPADGSTVLITLTKVK